MESKKEPTTLQNWGPKDPQQSKLMGTDIQGWLMSGDCLLEVKNKISNWQEIACGKYYTESFNC